MVISNVSVGLFYNSNTTNYYGLKCKITYKYPIPYLSRRNVINIPC